MDQFLYHIAKIQLTEDDKNYIQGYLAQDVSWSGIVKQADIEGISGLLYFQLKNHGFKIPPEIEHILKDNYRRITLRTMTNISQLRQISKLAMENQIPVIVLQGLSLNNLYKDPGLRPFLDIDLMVKPCHYEALIRILHKDGFNRVLPQYPHYLYSGGCTIEVHTHPLEVERINSRRYIFPLDIDAMWENAVPFFDQSTHLFRLDPYDNLIALAAHTLKHSYSKLIWLTDIHELVLAISADEHHWDKIINRARFWYQERVVLYALILVEQVFGLNIPGWVKQKLGIKRLSSIEKFILRLRVNGFRSSIFCIILWLYSIKGLIPRFKFVMETVFPRGEVMHQIFPEESSKSKLIIILKRIKVGLHLISVTFQDLIYTVRKKK